MGELFDYVTGIFKAKSADSDFGAWQTFLLNGKQILPSFESANARCHFPLSGKLSGAGHNLNAMGKGVTESYNGPSILSETGSSTLTLGALSVSTFLALYHSRVTDELQ
jgi:hypothetical protein